MDTFKIKTNVKEILADVITPVSIYLKIRDIYQNSVLLESSDYHGNENSYSFIGVQPCAGFIVNQGKITTTYPDGSEEVNNIKDTSTFAREMDKFLKSFYFRDMVEVPVNGLFGYAAYDAVEHFETIKLKTQKNEAYAIPEIRYHFYKYVIAINHYKNNLLIIENIFDNEASKLQEIEDLLKNRNIATYPFKPEEEEVSNITDEDYKQMVTRGKQHCYRGDVFQIVLSRQFSKKFTGDEFNVYRALRSINPSPYLFYFDYGNYRIFGSSPEAQLKVQKGKGYINPIAGTFRRTGDDEKDKALANELSTDLKENAEHVMLVDLARNDLSRQATNVKVENYREIQYYSHVLHMVSTVSGELTNGTNTLNVMTSTFPAGTLSGAPKFKAMELIDKYENQKRGYYGGAIGYLGFNGDFNHAIMIRSFLSKNNTLFYQAG
ncbi:MAG: anthranilate synthase component I family protein, partial [Bacteroidota bacterium]